MIVPKGGGGPPVVVLPKQDVAVIAVQPKDPVGTGVGRRWVRGRGGRKGGRGGILTSQVRRRASRPDRGRRAEMGGEGGGVRRGDTGFGWCIFIHNTNTLNALQNAVVWVTGDVSGGATIAIAVDSTLATLYTASGVQALTSTGDTATPGAGITGLSTDADKARVRGGTGWSGFDGAWAPRVTRGRHG